MLRWLKIAFSEFFVFTEDHRQSCSNLVIFRHCLPSFRLLNNRTASQKQCMYAFTSTPIFAFRAYILYGWSPRAILSLGFFSEIKTKIKFFLFWYCWQEFSFTIIHHNAFPDLCYDEIIPDVKFKNLSINEFIFLQLR